MSTNERWAIFLNGSYGVGKSTTLDHIGDLLAEAGQPFSLMDVDWFHRSWPPAADDPDNTRIEAQNMAAVWRSYQSAGPRQLVISGVVASQADVDRYSSAVGLRVRPIRLVASRAVAEARLRARYSAAQGKQLNWHLHRHEELSARLDEADLDEAIIVTDALTPAAVAEAVLAHVGDPPGAAHG